MRKLLGVLDNDNIQIPNLVQLQRDSYDRFLQADTLPEMRKPYGLQFTLQDLFPIIGNSAQVDFLYYFIEESNYDAFESKYRGITYGGGLCLRLSLTKWSFEDGKRKITSVEEQDIYVGEIPYMTESGSFVINGSERAVISQIHRSPGVFFDKNNAAVGDKVLYTARVIPNRGSWLDFEFDVRDVLHVRVDRRKKIPVTKFLMSIGNEETDLIRASGGKVPFNQMGEMTHSDILREFYRIITCKKDQNGWIIDFDLSSFIGQTYNVDICHPKNGDILLKAGEKLTRSKKDRFHDLTCVKVKYDFLLSQYLVDDVVNSVGAIIYKAGEIITDEILSVLSKSFDQIEIISSHDLNSPYILDMIASEECCNREEALMEVYQSLKIGESAKLEVIHSIFESLFFNPTSYSLSEIGRMKMNLRLKLDASENLHILTCRDILEIIRILIDLRNGIGQSDDIDSLEHRRVRSVGELVDNQCRQALIKLARAIKDKLNVISEDETKPADLINARPFISAIRDFFATSQLSQFLDQTNPLSEIGHKRRISAFGPGGLNRDRAWLDVRDLHFTHYGRICMIETPEGASIGLINSLTVFSRINSYGFVETPYHRVKNGVVQTEIVYMTAIEDKNHVIAYIDYKILDENKKIIVDKVHCRKGSQEMLSDPDEVEYIDISPKQVISVSSSLIPFVECDDASRALMGSNMQRQAVPLIKPDVPIVGTGMESVIVKNSNAVIFAKRSGVVVKVDANAIVVRADDVNLAVQADCLDSYYLRKFEKTNDSTCFHQYPAVSVGDKVEKGDVLVHGSAVRNGELALGKNVKVAFLSWRGGNYEDAVLISSKLVREFSSIHIEKHEISVREIKQGIEQITRDIPGINDEFLLNLDEAGIVHIGAKVGPGDVLVGRVTPKAETPMTPDERLLRAIFEDKAIDVRDSSLRVPAGVYGTVVDVQIFTRRGLEKNDRTLLIEKEKITALNQKCKLELRLLAEEYKKEISNLIIGKMLKRSYENMPVKHVLQQEDIDELTLAKCFELSIHELDLKNMEKVYTAKNTKIRDFYDREIQRISSGYDLPTGVLQVVNVYIAMKNNLQIGDKIAGRHGNKCVVSKILNVEDMPFTKDGEPVDMILTSLGISSRMNIGQILETHLGFAGLNLGKKIGKLLKSSDTQEGLTELRDFVQKIYNSQSEREIIKSKSDTEVKEFAKDLVDGVRFKCPSFNGPDKKTISELLKLAGCDESGQEVLYDGYTGLPLSRKVTIGVMYIMQLHHLVSLKQHARSVGPYSLVTQQPLGGKAQFGGQRLGEMEVWALQGYGAAYSIHESLTVKSDDIAARSRVFETLTQGYDVFHQNGLSESFRVLLYELRALCLNIECLTCEKGRFVSQDLTELDSFDALSISIASPDQIRSWSYGEVTKPETIHYRTLKPDSDGLFSARIFGPLHDYECLCGKHKRMRYRGIICDKCGVEVTVSRVRRERMGHIELASPVAHIWFSRILPSRIGMILDISISNLDKILHFESYVVTNAGTSPFNNGDLLSESEYENAISEYGYTGLKIDSGASAIEMMLKALDLDIEIEKIKQLLRGGSNHDMKRQRLIKKLKIFETFKKNKSRPEWMIIHVLPVLPPELRPLVMLDGVRFAASDINDFYRRVINRNNRLSRLMSLGAPDIIIRNEKRMLQEAIDSLFDNSRRSKPITSANNKRPLKSLSDTLKGKHGRFRQNLLGKRVDYSGRSVIVVGPNLKLNQCGLPKEIALELFKPFVLARLELRGFASTLRIAKMMIEQRHPEVWSILEEVITNHPVLLNRAPTLHRLGIQAFDPVLIEGKAIQLHPLTCTAFNADFDGDQVAVHVPLSIEAQLEARMLMMSTKCLVNPSNGKVLAKPSKDMVLGIFALTMEERNFAKDDIFLKDIYAAEHSLVNGAIELTTPIYTIVKDRDEKSKYVHTTLGRLRLFESLPKSSTLLFKSCNMTFRNQEIVDLVSKVHMECSENELADFLQSLMRFGFLHSTLSGVSFGMNDLHVPSEKAVLVQDTQAKVTEFHGQYMDGLITDTERYNKVIAEWYKCVDEVGQLMMRDMSKQEDGVRMNSVYMMSYSGARGSPAQLRQLAGMRGLIAKSDGSIPEIPILNSFIEGIKVQEYILAAHGSRKGLSDVALKTANCGYLTRRLVDVSQDCIIDCEDCGTIRGVNVQAIQQGNVIVTSLSAKILGRVLAEDVVNPIDSVVIAHAGEIVTREIAANIENTSVSSVCIRSPVTCDLNGSAICARCYGYDLSKQEIVHIGEPVGVIAAQSLGEPATQLTLQTFHSGGVAQSSQDEAFLETNISCKVVFNNLQTVTYNDQKFNLSRKAVVVFINDHGIEVAEHRIPYGARILINEGETVEEFTRIAEWDSHSLPILAAKGGRVQYKDFVRDVVYKEVFDDITGSKQYIVLNWAKNTRNAGLKPTLLLCDENGDLVKFDDGTEIKYNLMPDDTLFVSEDSDAKPGEVLVRRNKSAVKTQDIVGGLPRIVELFEVRDLNNTAMMSEVNGVIEFRKDYRSKHKIVVLDLESREVLQEVLVSKEVNVLVQNGDEVQKGDLLTDGNPSLQDVLRIQGVEAMTLYFIQEIQKVYCLQGITINDKHIEVIVRQMLCKVQITNSGDSDLFEEEIVPLETIVKANTNLRKQGKELIEYVRVVQGITKTSVHAEDSFFAPASFQDTPRVLTDAALSHSMDFLKGMKESLIAGCLIPAGTGKIVRDLEAEDLKRRMEFVHDSAEEDNLLSDEYENLTSRVESDYGM
mgnify:CR=1 FL=1